MINKKALLNQQKGWNYALIINNYLDARRNLTVAYRVSFRKLAGLFACTREWRKSCALSRRVFFRKLAALVRFYFEAPGNGFFSNSLFPCV